MTPHRSPHPPAHLFALMFVSSFCLAENVDISTLATLVSLGRLDLSRSVSQIIPLEHIHEGIRALEHAEGNPIRIVVAP